MILTIGAVRDTPSVVGGAIAVRKHVSIGVVFDHRVMDGYHAGAMARHFRRLFEDPEREL